MKGDKITRRFLGRIRKNKIRIAFTSIALTILILATFFPIYIERCNPNNAILQIGQGTYMLTIGNPVYADGEFDYTCDGIADEVQWQAILNDLPSIGGQILAHAGAYNFTAGETVTRAIDNISIIGVGASVSFEGDGVTPVFEAGGNNWVFSHLVTDAGGIDMGSTTDWMWLHVFVDTSYYPLRTDGINIVDHSSLHRVGGSDTIFPADPNADKFLMWDDDPGQLSWEDAGTGTGDMLKSTYDTDEDGDIDTAAGGTEWDSSAATGVAYITAGAWGTRATGITNTYILVVDGTPNDDEYARFTAGGLEGRTENEFKADYNLEPGVDIQAYDAELAAIAGLTSAANKLIYFTGSGTADTSDLTSFARSILDDANEATFKATVNLEIGTDVQAWDADLDDIAALSDADSNFIVGNGANWVVESGATVRQSLGLVIGTDVQAYDAELAALAGLTSAADKVPYFTGSETAAVADLTSYGRSLIAVVDEAAFKLLVNLEIGVDIISKSTFDTHEAATTGVHGVTGDIVGTSDTQTLSNKTLGGDLDFAEYTAIAMVCDHGTTMPVGPTNGQWYLHTPTGRNVLYQYNSEWIPIISVGSMTLYVDATDGTNDLDYGYGVDSAAFATVQYAVDCIPGLVGGNVIININDEDYDETVIIQGKSFTGSYTITLKGELAQQDTGTIDSAVQGSGATQGSITDAGEFGSYDNMLIYANSEYRLIDSDTSDIATIVGCWSATPSGTWVVYNWDTTINKIYVKNGQVGVYLYDIKLDIATGLTVSAGSKVNGYRSHIARANVEGTATVLIDLCYITYSATSVIDVSVGGYLILYRSKLYSSGANTAGIRLYSGGIAYPRKGTVMDASTTTGTYGLQIYNNSSVDMWTDPADGYPRIRNQAKGIYSYNGGQVVYTSNNQYSGNTVNEDAVAASYGYID